MMQLTKHWAGQLDDYVIDLAWAPDGSQLAAASAAGPVTLFAAADGATQHELPGHEGGTNALAWRLTRGERQEAGGERAEGLNEKSAAGSPSSPTPLASRLLLATGGQDGAVKFWDAAAGQHTATAKLGSTWVEHLAWRAGTSPSPVSRPLSPDLLFAAAGRTLTAIRPDATIAHAFKPAPKTITALAAQPAGGCVAAACYGSVTLWDADDFVAQKELPYANGIHALVWSPDNKWLVSGNQDPSVHLWIPAEDIELHMSGYEGKVRYLSFDHTSRWLATSGGREACIWDCLGAGPEGREPAMLPHDAPVCFVSFQNTHSLLATGASDGVVQLWSPERRQPLRATVRMPGAATKLAWSPDDRYLAIGTEKGAVYVLKCEA
ncbi:WD40 repeat domain-containing protein [Horticoccus sp. 23ND18S-11]|uniref:WD40 repeat domain-containing protein n=1 Tax=Horticoccus sp. 23ND18S-11 TaxID=3391832 RepID=UPI0039C921FC